MDTKTKRGQKVTLSHQDNVWLLMTDEEKQAHRDADRDIGRFHDDGGEPILYGPYMGLPAGVNAITVEVTSFRPKWESYSRPQFLVAGWSAELGREVLFQLK